MSTSNGTTHDNGHAADEMIDVLYSYFPGTTPAPHPCPEALFSCTLEGAIDGHRTLLTARGMTAAEFKANLQAIRGLLDQPQPAPTQGQGEAPIKDWCPVHQTRMYLNQKDGRSWYSHRTAEGTFCKGK
jgi:hypothetical protein